MSNSIINKAVEAVIALVPRTVTFATPYRGALGTENGICFEIGPTSPEAVFLDKNQYIPIDLTINGKHDNLEILSDQLNNLHEALTTSRSYPSSTNWKIVDITTLSEPQVIAREDSGQWIMASAILVKLETKL